MIERPYKILTPAEREARLKGIGGSDARKLMNGGAYDLWRVKTGRDLEEDYSDAIWAQMGHYTEPFNAWWLESHYGVDVRYDVAVSPAKVHQASPFLRCTPDGEFTVLTDRDDLQLPVGAWGILELKHVNPFQHHLQPLQDYYSQCQHNMLVAGAPYCLLSVLFGNSKHEVFAIAADRTYQGKLLATEEKFWTYVELDVPPDIEVPDLGIAKAQNVARNRILSIKGQNFEPQFRELEDTWTRTKPAAQLFKSADEALKAMVPDDVALLVGEKVTIGVAKNNAKTVRYRSVNDQEKLDNAGQA